jgi:hypothetical protein
MNKTTFLFLIILLGSCLTNKVNAQEQTQRTKTLKNTITLHSGRLLFNETRLGYERLYTDLNSWRVVLGLQYPGESNSLATGYEIFPIPKYHRVSKGIYIGAGHNHILGVRSRVYVSTEVYFNYNSYDKIYHSESGASNDSYVALESMDLTKTGIKLLFGKKARILTASNIGLELDFFAGFGLQFMNKKLTAYEKRRGSSS